MKAMKKYWTLAVLQDNRWCVEFGDWDLDTVRDERAAMREGWENYKNSELKIFSTDGKQSSIDAMIAQYNAV